MSTYKYDWWLEAKNWVRNYPKWVREWEELKTISATPDYSAVGHGSGVSNPTEQVALRVFPEPKQKKFDAVRAAIAETEKQPDGRNKIRFIRLVYWKRTHTIAGAAMQVYTSEQTGKIWNGDFIRLVGVHHGEITREEYQEAIRRRNKKHVRQSQKQVL